MIPTLDAEYVRCSRCRIWIEVDEYVINYGVCESCFSDDCFCTEGRPDDCPLHEWPDVYLGEFENRRLTRSAIRVSLTT